MFRQKLKVSLSTKIHRRPNVGAINLLEASAVDIDNQLKSLLSNSNFQYLRSIGVVKRSSSGRIPFTKYQEFKDQEMLNFVSKHDLEQKTSDWFSILSSRSLPMREIADLLGTPLEETIKVVTYLRSNNEISYETSGISSELINSPEEHGVHLALEEETALAQISDFVEQYELDSVDFRKLFCQTKEDQTSTAKRHGIPNNQLQTTETLVNTFLIRDLVYRDSDHESLSVPAPHIIGSISIHPYSGAVILDLDSWAKKAGSFYIQQDLLKSNPAVMKASELKSLLTQVEALQHYTSTLTRVVETIVKRQEDFLISGSPTALAPLPQSWIAKECGLPRSSVCRIIRNKVLDSPHGAINLKQLCSTVGDVIRLLAHSNPDWNARKIAEYLQGVHSVRMTIRNVNYHLTAN